MPVNTPTTPMIAPNTPSPTSKLFHRIPATTPQMIEKVRASKTVAENITLSSSKSINNTSLGWMVPGASTIAAKRRYEVTKSHSAGSSLGLYKALVRTWQRCLAPMSTVQGRS